MHLRAMVERHCLICFWGSISVQAGICSTAGASKVTRYLGLSFLFWGSFGFSFLLVVSILYVRRPTKPTLRNVVASF